MEGFFKTDRGKVRSHNEDTGSILHNDKGEMLAVVADGMGGHRAGDIASSLTRDLLKERWEAENETFSEGRAKDWCLETVQAINRRLLSYTDEYPECRGMGTTLVMALCTDDFIVISNVGDSRCYVLKEETFAQVTDDHSLVGELVRQGQITEEEADFHPRKHVLLRALGTEEQVEIEIETCRLNSGQLLLLLCSDGLTNKVTDEQLEEVLRSNTPLEEKADQLVEMANDAGGEDNITLALVNLDRKNHGEQAGDNTDAG